MDNRVCTKCKQVLPATTDYFYKKTSIKIGLESQCKTCRSKVIAEWQANNKNKVNQYFKKYAQKNKESRLQKARDSYHKNKDNINARRRELWEIDKEHKKDYQRKWYAANKEKMQAWYREWYQGNKEKAKAATRAWVKNNPDKTRIVCQKRKAKARNLPFTLTNEQWAEAKEYFNNECAYCGAKTALTQEHFVPLSKQGDYTVNNIIPACQFCNSSKQDRDFFVWYPRQDFYSKNRERKILKRLNYHNGFQQTSIYQQILI